MDPTYQTDTGTLAALSGLVDLPEQGTLFTACIHKMGEERGPAGNRKVYGDDTKQVLIWTGFSHRALVQRSMRVLSYQLSKGRYIEKIARATLEVHSGTTIEDVCHALQEIRDTFRKTLAMSPDAPDPDSQALDHHSWRPLEINGFMVRGCLVYVGPARPEDPRAPVPGTIYIKGLKLGERMVTPAPNGRWMADSKPKTLAKQIIRESLPIGLYCQYRLDPSRVSGLAVADAAVQVAKEQGIPIDPGALTSLFKVG